MMTKDAHTASLDRRVIQRGELTYSSCTAASGGAGNPAL